MDYLGGVDRARATQTSSDTPEQTVLLVDRASRLDESLAALQREDWEVVGASTVTEARQVLRTESVAGIVSELALSGGTGLELLEVVRETSDLPFVLWTDAGDETVAGEAIAAGVTHYVPRREGAALVVERLRDALSTGGTRGHGQLLDDALNRVTDAFYVLDDEWRFTFLNERTEELLDTSEGELLGVNVWEAFPRAMQRSYREYFERAMASQEPVVFEEYSETAGSWLELHVYPSESGLSVTFQDITDRKERERQLEQYETIVETVDDGIYAVNENDEFVLVNDAFCEMVGWDHEDLLGEHPAAIHEEVPSRDAWLVDQVAAGELESATVEATLRAKDGSVFPVEGRVRPYPLETGTGRCGVVRDISERKEHERELRAARERYQTLVQGAPDPIFVADADSGEIVETNSAAGSLRRESREEIRGLRFTDLHPEGRPTGIESCSSACAGKAVRCPSSTTARPSTSSRRRANGFRSR
ncbi:PAS domain S-box protein [Haloarculaceae archaeon H-GB2-1]|nr:PAS domain S-box protein [Haloarculaceae archaeon H-GB2-1]